MMRVLAGLVVAVGMAGAAAPVPNDRAKDPVYYPTAKGAQWRYEVPPPRGGPANPLLDLDRVVTAVAQKGGAAVLTVEPAAGAVAGGAAAAALRVRVEVAGGGVWLVESGGERWNPPLPQLPRRPGEVVEVRGKLGGRAATGTVTAHPPEVVVVPAGRFRAVRVEFDLTVGGFRSQQIAWYAENVGLVRSVARVNGADREWVLKAFKPAP